MESEMTGPFAPNCIVPEDWIAERMTLVAFLE